MPRTSAVVLTAAILTGALVSAPALAQTFPTKPIRIIVPTAPGGGYDFVARLLADALPKELGQTLVVDNRPGAGSLIGTQAAAASPADGYTLLVGGLANLAFSPGLYEKLPYDPVADFVPIGLVGTITYTLVGRNDLPQSTLAELIEFARANPGKLTIATAGTGTGQHIAAALLKRLGKLDLVEVPYKGAQPAYTDLLGGRVDLFFDNTTTARPLLDSGRLKAFVTSGSARDSLLPKVPTGREAGVEGLVLESWIGVFAPAKTPRPIVDRLQGAVAKALESPEVRQRLQSNGWRILSMSPQETERFVKDEAEKWPQFLKQAGIKAE